MCRLSRRGSSRLRPRMGRQVSPHLRSSRRRLSSPASTPATSSPPAATPTPPTAATPTPAPPDESGWSTFGEISGNDYKDPSMVIDSRGVAHVAAVDYDRSAIFYLTNKSVSGPESASAHRLPRRKTMHRRLRSTLSMVRFGSHFPAGQVSARPTSARASISSTTAEGAGVMKSFWSSRVRSTICRRWSAADHLQRHAFRRWRGPQRRNASGLREVNATGTWATTPLNRPRRGNPSEQHRARCGAPRRVAQRRRGGCSRLRRNPDR